MTWLNASEHLVIDAATRYRVEELHAAVQGSLTHQGTGQNPTSTTVLRVRLAVFLGLVGLAAASSVGCATAPRPSVVGAGTSEAAGDASLGARAPEVPNCRGMGSYNRAANLCVSEGI